MTAPKYVVGIDLGTTHCALAFAPVSEPVIRLLPVPQLVAPGEVNARPLLPSFLYLSAAGELPASECALPWGGSERIVGELARRRGAKAPGRLVASAKSWICHGGVNRRAQILPWGTPDDEPHVSPYEAQVAYLSHLEQAWSHKYPGAALKDQDIVVTVPASFDEGARTLTSDAAAQAGLGQVRLLEEPQAALYDYLGAHSASELKGRLAEELAAAKLILVVDVGGGTTDLTLLRILGEKDEQGLPKVERIAVGGHLMLGGDNMDAALALHALDKAGIPRPDDATVWSGVVQSAREAKERLLAADAPSEAVISYQRRGSRLIGATKSMVVTRAEALAVLLDGFFPLTAPSDVATRRGRSGLTTLGLPFTSDAAVPRHVATFLKRHLSAATEAGAHIFDGLPKPDLLLLNGGVFNAPSVVERLQAVLAGWYSDSAVQLLEHTSLDTSVASGAARFALARRGVGTVISGGTAKAYYVGLEHGGRDHALCLAPKNAEDGAKFVVSDRILELRLNEPVAFPLFAYSGDRVDVPGRLLDVEQAGDELEPLPPLRTLLRAKSVPASRQGKSDGPRPSARAENTVRVTLESGLDESGALQLFLVTVALPPTRWKLEFVLRGDATRQGAVSGTAASGTATAGTATAGTATAGTATAGTATADTTERDVAPPHAKLGEVQGLVKSSFISRDEVAVKDLRAQLERLLGQRGEWSAATCRAVFDACLKQCAQRARSEQHELNWLRLCSWTLRPGFGVSGDEARIDALWELRSAGPAVPSKTNWAEWWVLWRRVAAGLSQARQQALYEDVRFTLWPESKLRAGDPERAGEPLRAGLRLDGPVEMMRLLAALERLGPDVKARAGKLFIERAKKLGSYWPLGRVGARVPFHGDAASVVATSVAEDWLRQLLHLDWSKAEGADFAAASIARRTGDAREVNNALRDEVLKRLEEAGAKPSWCDLLRRVDNFARSDVKRVLGDSLPPGLRLD